MEQEENEIGQRINNNLLFTRKKYALEMNSIREIARKEKLIYIIGGIASILILICLIIGLILKNTRLHRRLAETEKNRLKAEMSIISDELTAERSHLEDLLEERKELSDKLLEKDSNLVRSEELSRQLTEEKKELSARLDFIIRNRLEMVNGMLAKEISNMDKFADAYDSLSSRIHRDKETFMNSIREDYSRSHPRFINYLSKQGLTDTEINYVCLYCLGLRGKEIGIYLGKKNHYNRSADIRKKLGLEKTSSNLGPYVRELLEVL